MLQAYNDFASSLDRFLNDSLTSNIELVALVTDYLHKSGGKRIRPRLCYLVGRTLGCKDFGQLIQTSGIIELIHSATLMHDDVVDQSTVRRGVVTVNKHWGAPAAILTGDFIYSRAFQLATALENIAIARLLADISNILAEGEIIQLVHVRKADTNEATYFDIIYKKTGALFAASCQCAALLTNSDEQVYKATGLLGKNTGIAFQIIDDLLDYTGDRAQMGKQQGADFYEGKITLPLIRLFSILDKKQIREIEQQLGTDDKEAFELVSKLVKETGSDDYCIQKARELINQGIDAFTSHTRPSKFRDQLIATIESLIQRQS